MDYENASDFEINKRVAECEFYPVRKIYKANDTDESVTVLGKVAYSNFDPCNNPANAWPIITENKIGIWTHPSFDPLWTARYNIVGKKGKITFDVYHDKNPLRAAMIVYLMMQEGKQCLASQ